MTPEQAARKYGTQKHVEQQEFVQVYYAYENELATCGLLDYDDLLVRCVELLRHHPKCVSNVQAVLVDEFQDTNHIQYELMNLFASASRRITIVGDPDQSIYGFRAAEIKNLTRMQQLYRDTSIVLLEDNYRSSGAILSSAQDVIEQDVSRPAKKLQATHSVGQMPVLRRVPTNYDEAEWIVLEIKRSIAMTGGVLKYSDFAILLRTAALSQLIETEMGRHGIPYRMVGGLRFFDRVEIKVLLDYLRVVSSPGNNEALLRVINVPSRRIGDETVKMLANGAQTANMSLWEFLKAVAQGRKAPEKALSKLTDQGLSAFVGIIESSRQKLREITDNTAPKKLLEYLIKKISFRDYLTNVHGQNEENRWANVEELLNQAGSGPDEGNQQAEAEEEEEESLPPIDGIEQQQTHPGEDALSRFLANVALSTEIKPHDTEQGEAQPDDKVTISTIHAAKGLEWPVVFIPSVHQGIIPHSRSEDEDEERRLLYVAMTRAQALLYLSAGLRVVNNRTDTSDMSLSSFISPSLVNKRFRRSGPNFPEKVVYEIANILNRPQPSPETMRSRETQIPGTITSAYDDRWMADGSDNPDAVQKRWNGLKKDSQEPDSKRRRFNQDTTKPTTTFMSAASYTMSSNPSAPSTTMSGFSTAREYIATTSTSNTSKPSVPSGPTRNNSGNNSNRNSNNGLSQGSISNYFGQPAKAQSQPQPQPQAQAPVQPHLQPRRLPSAKTLQPPRPALEPSDPNSYTWLATPSRPMGKPLRQKQRENDGRGEGDGDGKEEDMGKDDVNEVKNTQNTRPATTFHTTTMSVVQQQQQQQQSGPARRTLGIRRTMMNGWQERMNRAPNGREGL